MKFIKNFLSALIVFCVIIGIIAGIYGMYPLKYVGFIRAASEEAGVDRYLTAALIKAESNFNPQALSNADAKGLMQLTDETAQFCAEKMGIELSEGDIYNPEINIKIGVYYLKRLLDMFDSDLTLAVAAYNAGEGRVKEWLANAEYSADGVTLDTIPYGETKRHVEKIGQYQKIYKILYPEL